MSLKEIYKSIKNLNFDDAVDAVLDIDSASLHIDIDTRSMCIILSDSSRCIKIDYTFTSKQKVAVYSTEKVEGESDVEVVNFKD